MYVDTMHFSTYVTWCCQYSKQDWIWKRHNFSRILIVNSVAYYWVIYSFYIYIYHFISILFPFVRTWYRANMDKKPRHSPNCFEGWVSSRGCLLRNELEILRDEQRFWRQVIADIQLGAQWVADVGRTGMPWQTPWENLAENWPPWKFQDQ